MPELLDTVPNRTDVLIDANVFIYGLWANTQRLLALNVLFLPLELSIVTGAQPERVAAGLLTNDSMIVAAMRRYGVSLIATNDRQFNAVPGITVFSPSDVR